MFRTIQFESIEDLNAFLMDNLGLPPISPEEVEQAMQAEAQQGEPVNETPSPTDILETELEDKFDSLMELSIEQIGLVVKQRDEARQMYEHEVLAHLTCHEHMLESLHKMRIYGYTEAIAAGLFPGVTFEELSKERQESINQSAGSAEHRSYRPRSCFSSADSSGLISSAHQTKTPGKPFGLSGFCFEPRRK